MSCINILGHSPGHTLRLSMVAALQSGFGVGSQCYTVGKETIISIKIILV